MNESVSKYLGRRFITKLISAKHTLFKMHYLEIRSEPQHIGQFLGFEDSNYKVLPMYFDTL